MISILIWIILGFLAGLLAKLMMPGTDNGGFILTTVLGIIGAVVGGYVGSLLGFELVSSFNNIGNSLPGFIFSVVGTIVVLAIYRFTIGKPLTA